MKQSFVALILAVALGLVTGCEPQPDLTGFYQSPWTPRLHVVSTGTVRLTCS